MLRMGKLTDYGIVLMSYLSGNTNVHHNAQTLAAAVRVPLPTVRKVLKALSQSGLLNSERGAHGGYSLAKAAKAISIAEVISAIEGPIALTECVSEESHCDQEVHCLIQTNWERINSAVYHALDEVKLSDMLLHRTHDNGVSQIHFYSSVPQSDLVIKGDGDIHG
jgi:FeS assembly SUF system regulator